MRDSISRIRYKWGDRESFEALKSRCRERFSEDFVRQCLAALAKGQLSLPERFSSPGAPPN